MKKIKTFKHLFEKNMIKLIQRLDKEELIKSLKNFNLGEKLIYSYLYDNNDNNIKILIDINIDYKYTFLKYAYTYDRIELIFDVDDFNDYFEFYENEIFYYIDYNHYNIPEEYIDISDIENYFDINKLKKLLFINNDNVNIYDILNILEKTIIENQLGDIKDLIAITYEQAKEKIAKEIYNQIPFEISYENKTIIITISLIELDNKKTVNDFLLKYKDILSQSIDIQDNFYNEITTDFTKDIPEIVENIYILLEDDLNNVINSLNINMYDINNIIDIGGILLEHIKTEKFQNDMIFNNNDLYKIKETYKKFENIIHPKIKNKYKKLITKTKFNL